MAIRVNSDASALKRSANAPSQTSLTAGCWVYYDSVTPARFHGPLGIYNGSDGSPTPHQQFQISSTASGSASMSLFVGQTVDIEVPLHTAIAGRWFFYALTCSALTSGGVRAYVRQHGVNSFTTVSNGSTGGTWTPQRFEFGRDAFTGDFIDGAVKHCFMFDRVLDANELLRLSYDLLAEKIIDRRNLNVYYRLRGANDILDWSGNGRNPTFTPGVGRPSIRVLVPKRRLIADVSSGITGTLAKTLDALTAAGAGTVNVDGTLSKTLGTLTAAGQGAVDVAGTLAKTLGDVTAVGAGAVNVDGSLTKTLDDLTCVAEGTVIDPLADIEGELDATLDDLTAAGTGTVTVDGTLAKTLGDVTAAGTGTVTIEGTLAKTLAALTCVGAGDNGDVGPAANDGDWLPRWRRLPRR